MKTTNRPTSRKRTAKTVELPKLEGVARISLRRGVLMTGTAIATGAFAGLAGMVVLPTPAMAQCALFANGLADDTVTCVGKIDGATEGSIVAEDDTFVFTSDLADNPTFFFNTGPNPGDTGLYVDGRGAGGGNDGGYSITVDTYENTAVQTDGGTGIAVETEQGPNGNGLANIVVTNRGFIEAGGNGIYAASYGVGGGAVTVTNSGIIGVQFDTGFDLVASQFVDAGGAVTLTEGSAFIIAPVGNNGIVAQTDAPEMVSVTNSGQVYATTAGILAHSSESIVISNTGTIQGGTHGIDVTGDGTASVSITNRSYNSVVGAISGENLVNVGQVFLDNGGGVTAGLGDEGINIETVTGPNGVRIINHGGVFEDEIYGGGVIAGRWDGIDITGVNDAAGSIVIGNGQRNGLYEAGLIVGVGGDGIDVENVSNNVVITNDGTRMGTLLGADIDGFNDQVLSVEGTGLLGETDVDVGAGALRKGIWGLGGHGISAENVGGMVGISNVDGIIVGDGDGIRVRGVDGANGDQTGLDDLAEGGVRYSLYLNNNGGIVWGGDDAIDGADLADSIGESVWISNGTGDIFGVDSAIRLRNVTGGDIDIDSNGLIQGLRGDAITIDGVTRTDGFGGSVRIDNDVLGTIIAGDSAIVVRNANYAFIANEGLIFGDGDRGQTVIEFEAILSEGELFSAVVNNDGYGIMASRSLPHFDYSSWAVPEKGELPDPAHQLAESDLRNDLADLETYVLYGGSMDLLDGIEEWENDYAEAASDRLVRSDDGGATEINNGINALMVGRINLDGNNGIVGNTINNEGQWLVTGWNELSGGPNDEINNSGWIQSAFIDWDDEWTSFRTNQFNNSGVLSLVDGGVDDRMTIRGNYNGGVGSPYSGGGGSDMFSALVEPESEGYDSTGLLALDVDLSGYGDADRLRLRDGSVNGQTGIIVRLVNDDNGEFGTEIDLVSYDDYETSPDAFFLSDMSDNYLDMGGTSFIEDGLLAWFLQQDTYNDEFELVAGWGPGAINAPAVITGAQNIFYETLGVVEDHIYGGQFEPSGGGGADLLYIPEEGEAPVAGGRQGGIWAKATGSWIDRDTSVTLDTPVTTTFDTSTEQDVYSVMAGADFKPGGIGSPFRIGVFGGYVASDLSFALGDDGVVYEGGLVGAYAAYNDGALFADVTVKADLLNATYTFFDEEVEASVNNYGFAANAGYRFDIGSAFFEPVASLAYVTSEVDDISAGGGDVTFDDGTSLRAGIGAKIGTTLVTGEATTELSLLGKLWNEFEDANTVTVSNVGTASFSDDIGGMFGEVAATATMTSMDGGLSGFVSANGKFGENFTSYGASAGLRVGF